MDAWLTTSNEAQINQVEQITIVFLTRVPAKELTGAIVTVTDQDQQEFVFDEVGPGNYMWTPEGQEQLGELGSTLSLNIQIGQNEFSSENASEKSASDRFNCFRSSERMS